MVEKKISDGKGTEFAFSGEREREGREISKRKRKCIS